MDPKKVKHWTNLQEITFHFELQQRNKDGGDQKLIYCQFKIASEAIKLLIKTKGAIPNSYMHALNDNLRQANEIEQLKKITKDYSQVKKLIDEMEELKKENAQLKQEKDHQAFTGYQQTI